jgi:hypothetical protein
MSEPENKTDARRHVRYRDVVGGKLENVQEYANSYVFALFDRDSWHQEHFRKQLEAWLRSTLKTIEGVRHYPPPTRRATP